jgi:prolyl-tRNA synthetase
MKGVPLRLEIGPRDIENGQCVLVRRDNRQKYFEPLDTLEARVGEILEEYRAALYDKAAENRKNRTYTATDLDEMVKIAAEKSGYIKAMWCGDEACETALKEKAGVTSRCMPFDQEDLSDHCVCCGKPAKSMVVWGKAY